MPLPATSPTKRLALAGSGVVFAPELVVASSVTCSVSACPATAAIRRRAPALPSIHKCLVINFLLRVSLAVAERAIWLQEEETIGRLLAWRWIDSSATLENLHRN
jgi:hypothetical protein